MTAVIALFVGWLLTGIGWFVSQRAQKKLFLHQVKNTARGELVAALRTEQDVMGAFHGLIRRIDIERAHGLTSAWPQTKWYAVFEEYQRIAARSDNQWVFVLEQYQVLFSGTVKCRLQLVERAKGIYADVPMFFLGLIHPEDNAKTLLTAEPLMSRLSDQGALIEDVLVHIQNVTLGTLVRKKAPLRQPLDPAVPRIVMRRGELEIVDGNQAGKVK